MSHPAHSTSAANDPPRQRPWWVDSLLLVGCIAVAELCLHHAIELADLEMSDWKRSLVDAAGLALLIAPLFSWIMYRRHVDARLALDRFSRSGRAPNSPHTRVRVAVLGSLGVISALFAASLWGQISASSRLARELAAMEKTDEPAALQKILAILNEHAPKYYETAATA